MIYIIPYKTFLTSDKKSLWKERVSYSCFLIDALVALKFVIDWDTVRMRWNFTGWESLHKNIKLMLEFVKALFLVLHVSYYTLMTFLIMLPVILLSMLMILLSILNVIRYWSVATTRIGPWNWIWSTRPCDLRIWSKKHKKWLVDFNARKTQTLVLLMWKWMGLFLRKNNLLRCWGWLSLLDWIRVLTLSLLLKLPPKKLEPWFVLWSFFCLRLFCISINLPYDHAWNTVVTSGLVFPVATWNC